MIGSYYVAGSDVTVKNLTKKEQGAKIVSLAVLVDESDEKTIVATLRNILTIDAWCMLFNSFFVTYFYNQCSKISLFSLRSTKIFDIVCKEEFTGRTKYHRYMHSH